MAELRPRPRSEPGYPITTGRNNRAGSSWMHILPRAGSGPSFPPVPTSRPSSRTLTGLTRSLASGRPRPILPSVVSVLKVERLSKAFGTVRAVDAVSFEVRPGEIYGLLGPNGAGKTTTLSMIAGLLAPDVGEIFVEGRPFRADPAATKRVMGFVPQEIALYEELTGRENLEFWGRLAGLGRAAARARASELLEGLSLTERGDDPVRSYSGGMKRRINLGCALMHRPRLLLLDEPTVGIDLQARFKVLEFIRSLVVQGTAILYTTHYLEEAETLCDRIGILDHGQLLAEGSLGELQSQVGGQSVFILEGDLDRANPEQWPGFSQRFRILQKNARQLTVADLGCEHPAESLRVLLGLPVRLHNVTLKRPSLNELFLQLTGRELRE